MNIDDIDTFQKYERFSYKNGWGKAYPGFKVAAFGNGLFGFALGFDGAIGLENNIGAKLTGGFLQGGFFALFGVIIYGVPIGSSDGFFTLEENKLYDMYNYKLKDVYNLKFDYAD